MDLASLVFGGLIGALTSWFFSRHYYLESVKSTDENFRRQLRSIEDQTSMARFEQLLTNAQWEHQTHDGGDRYVCSQATIFQIDASDIGRSFSGEPWLAQFPDQTTSMFKLRLCINGVVVKEVPFISADGGRYKIPLPEIVVVKGTAVYFWRKGSLGYRVAIIMGQFYRCNNLAEVAQLLGLEIVDERPGFAASV